MQAKSALRHLFFTFLKEPWQRVSALTALVGKDAAATHHGVHGIEEAIERSNAYREAGADVIFPEGLHTEDEFAALAQASPGHLLANMTEFGKTPIIPLSRFEEMGYSIVIFPLSMMRVAMGAVVRGLAALKEEGSVEGLLHDMQDRAALYALMGYVPGTHWSFPGNKT